MGEYFFKKNLAQRHLRSFKNFVNIKGDFHYGKETALHRKNKKCIRAAQRQLSASL